MSQYAPFEHLISKHNNKFTTANVMLHEYILSIIILFLLLLKSDGYFEYVVINY